MMDVADCPVSLEIRFGGGLFGPETSAILRREEGAGGRYLAMDGKPVDPSRLIELAESARDLFADLRAAFPRWSCSGGHTYHIDAIVNFLHGAKEWIEED